MSIYRMPTTVWTLLKCKLKKLQSIGKAILDTHKIIVNISFCDKEGKEFGGNIFLVDMSILLLIEKGTYGDIGLSISMLLLLGPQGMGWLIVSRCLFYW